MFCDEGGEQEVGCRHVGMLADLVLVTELMKTQKAGSVVVVCVRGVGSEKSGICFVYDVSGKNRPEVSVMLDAVWGRPGTKTVSGEDVRSEIVVLNFIAGLRFPRFGCFGGWLGR